MEQRKQSGRIGIIWLGIVSLFNDLSSEVIARILPLFLIEVLKSSLVAVGVVEAISDATAILGKLVAGYFSDKFRRRKPFILLGYGISVIARPLVAVSQFVGLVIIARFLEKVGKSIRTAPRDALIADLSTEDSRGANFGLHRALDTVGAVIGLFFVAVFFHFRNGNEQGGLRFIILAASAAGVLALPVLWFFVHETSQPKAQPKKTQLSLKALDGRLRRYLAISFIFALANSSDAFLIVRAKDLGFSLTTIFLILIAFNAASIPGILGFSILSDRVGRKTMLLGGWLLYAVCYFLFGLPQLSVVAFTLVMMLYGAFYIFTDGVEKAMVADFQSAESKGQGYGWLALVQGLGVIPANIIFGDLYQYWGAARAFWISAGLALLGTILLSFFKTAGEVEHA